MQAPDYNLSFWITLSCLSSIPSELLHALSDDRIFENEIWQADISELREYGLSQSNAAAFIRARDNSKADAILLDCRQKGISVLPLPDCSFPSKLREIEAPPAVLYYRGVLPDFENTLSIAVVGARNAVPHSLNFAEKLGIALGRWGINVISGGAGGIDTAAMRGALQSGGVAVGVLANGPDIDYPAKNGGLFRQTAVNGCILSEYAPGIKPEKRYFPLRNRLISALSHGVVVVEASKISGSLHTARYALEQGRDLFSVPGPAGEDYCAGSNQLLRDGALFCEGIDDILACYSSQYDLQLIKRDEFNSSEPLKSESLSTSAHHSKAIPADIPENEAAVLRSMGNAACSPDSIISSSGLSPQEVLTCLTMLQIRGLIRAVPGGSYLRQ